MPHRASLLYASYPCFILLTVPGRGVFHRGFPLLSQSLAAAICHTTSKDYSMPHMRDIVGLESRLVLAFLKLQSMVCLIHLFQVLILPLGGGGPSHHDCVPLTPAAAYLPLIVSSLS